jgi:hypothetical protein
VAVEEGPGRHRAGAEAARSGRVAHQGAVGDVDSGDGPRRQSRGTSRRSGDGWIRPVVGR